MNWWAPGEIVRDTHILSIPEDTPAGAYSLRMGLYRLDTLTRVPLVAGGKSVNLGGITVR